MVVRPDAPLKVSTFDPDPSERLATMGGFDRRIVLAAAAAAVLVVVAAVVLLSGDDAAAGVDAGTELAMADAGTGSAVPADGGQAVAVLLSDAGSADAVVEDGGMNPLLAFDEPPEDEPAEDAGPVVNGSVRPKKTNPIDNEVKQVRLLMLKRGFWPGDLPAAESALLKAKSAARAGRTGEANKLVDQARAAIEKQNIDRAFVLAKLTRFNKKFDKSRQPQIANKVEPLAREAGQSFGAGDFDTANKKLNRAFALIGK